MRKKLLLIVLFSVCLFSQLFGFATIFSGGGDIITFTTNVTGVEVIMNGVPFAMIDGTIQPIKIKRQKGDVVMVFRKTGYHDRTIILEKSLSGFWFANFLIGGVYGSTTDSIFTNNWQEYSPNQYYIQMTKRQ